MKRFENKITEGCSLQYLVSWPCVRPIWVVKNHGLKKSLHNMHVI